MRRVLIGLISCLCVAPFAIADEPDMDAFYNGYTLLGEGDVDGALAVFKASCEAGIADACFEVSNQLLYGVATPDAEGAKAAFDKARAMLEADCDAGNSTACFSLDGQLRYSMEFPDVDAANAALAKGTALLATACDAGTATACFDLESQLRYNLEAPDEDGAVAAATKGKALLTASCDAGSSADCYDLESRLRYDVVSPDGVAADAARAKAAALEDAACTAGAYASCQSLADNILYAPMTGDGETTLQASDYAAIEAYLASTRTAADGACQAGDPKACVVLGQMQVSGLGGPSDTSGIHSLESACANGDEDACWIRYSLMADAGVDMKRDSGHFDMFLTSICADSEPAYFCSTAREYFDSSYKGADGTFTEFDTLTLLDFDATKAKCEAGESALACDFAAAAYYGSLRYKPGSTEAAGSMYRQSTKVKCDAGNLVACSERGWDLFYGSNGPEDKETARALFETVCASTPSDDDTYTVPSACSGIADMIDAEHPTEDGSPSEEARPYVQKACDAGDTWSCERLNPGSVFEMPVHADANDH